MSIETKISHQVLWKNYRKWNHEWAGNHSSWYYDRNCKYDKVNYPIFLSTNCQLTASMLQKKYGFGVGEMVLDESRDLFKLLQTENFLHLKLLQNGIIFHVITIVDDFAIHCFQDVFSLTITLIDDNWKKNFEDKNWTNICETDVVKCTQNEDFRIYLPDKDCWQ